jgi:hypothetical protein
MVTDLAATDAADLFAGHGPALVVGGLFNATGAGEANRIAAWRGCEPVACLLGDLNRDGSVGVADLLVLLAAWARATIAPTAPPISMAIAAWA